MEHDCMDCSRVLMLSYQVVHIPLASIMQLISYFILKMTVIILWSHLLIWEQWYHMVFSWCWVASVLTLKFAKKILSKFVQYCNVTNLKTEQYWMDNIVISQLSVKRNPVSWVQIYSCFFLSFLSFLGPLFVSEVGRGWGYKEKEHGIRPSAFSVWRHYATKCWYRVIAKVTWGLGCAFVT